MVLRSRPRSVLSRCCLLSRDAARRGRLRLLAAAVAAAALAGGASLGLAVNAPPAAPSGLDGLWPDFPPQTLSVESFDRLGGNWETWGRETSLEVAALYGLRDQPIEAQRAVVAKLEARARVARRALADPAYRPVWPDLLRIYGPLTRRTALAKAALDVLTADAAATAGPARLTATDAVRDALSGVDADLNNFANGTAWRKFVGTEQIRGALGDPAALRPLLEPLPERLNPAGRDAALRAFLERPSLVALSHAARDWTAADRFAERGVDAAAVREKLSDLIAAIDSHDNLPSDETAGRILTARNAFAAAAGPAAAPLLDVLRVEYLNYNIRLVADEAFLSKMVATHEIKTGLVRDCILGANVRGTQCTTVDARLELMPDPNVARFRLTLDGVANTRTNATTPQATVSSMGTNVFHATKPITFDGRQFTTNPADVAVVPNIRHLGAATKYDGLFFGLFKGAIRREAIKRANQRLPESRQIAVMKLRENLLPEFNAAVNQNFADLNGELGGPNGLTARAERMGVGPSVQRTLTTDDRFIYDMVVRGGGEVAGSPPNLNATRGVGFNLQIHETLLNNAADRWGFAGRTMNGDEIKAELETWFSQLLGKPISFGPSDPSKPTDPTRLIFADKDPIKFRVADGAVTLILRAGIEQPDGEDVPPQIVEVPLTVSVVGNKIQIERGTVRVSPLGRPANRATQFARAGVMRRKLEGAIENGSRDRTSVVDRPGRGPITITVERIDAEAGWLTVYGT